MKKRFKQIILSLLVVFITLIVYGLTSFNFRLTDAKIIKKFQRNNIDVVVKHTRVGHRNIRYVKTLNQEKKRLAVFVHGGPGSLSEYFGYLKNKDLLEEFQFIAIDRPGYGYSDLGQAQTNILEQARLLLNAIQKEVMNKHLTVVGHSYGAPIAAAMAMQDSAYIDQLVLVSGAMDPQKEKRFWFSNLTTVPWFYNFVSHSIRVAIDEKESHAEALEALVDKWENIKIPTIVIHGNKDKMVPVENVDFLKSVMRSDNVDFRIEDGVNHVIQFKHPKLIIEALLKN